MKTLVSLSGGIDSTTLLAYSLEKSPANTEVHTAFFLYPSRHNKREHMAFNAICDHYEVPENHRHLIHASALFAGFNSALLLEGDPIPHGHYESESMKKTVVPCRNLIFASILAGLAESLGIGMICLGVHAGDHHIYPDCRPEFVVSLNRVINEATEAKVGISAPFLWMKKKEILHCGIHSLNEIPPYELTWTCYDPQWDIAYKKFVSCGKCGACVERQEAFKEIGVHDPIKYMK